MEKEFVSACPVCRSAKIDGNVVSAGEYSCDDFNLSHGTGLSKACFRIVYGNDFPASDNISERCPVPKNKIGDILYIPKRDVRLPAGFFETVAPGYGVRIVEGPLSYPILLKDLLKGLDLKLVVSTEVFDSFTDGVCPNISGYNNSVSLIAEINFALRESRSEHYREHFS